MRRIILANNCSKDRRLTFRFIPLLAALVLLVCIPACGRMEETEQASGQERAAETSAEKVMPDMTEEKAVSGIDAEHTEEASGHVDQTSEPVPETTEQSSENREDIGMKKLRMAIDGTEVSVIWEENESVAALMHLVEESPITIQMSMYGGFEQVGPLGTSLPRNDVQITTEAGDIVLYSGNQIVVFYGSNAWAYTRLGHVDLSAAEMSELLSHGDVTVTLFN